MTLADYCLPGADPDLQEPLAGRLLGLLEHFDGRLMILSGRRSRGEQQRLYDAWVAGEGNYAAVPGTSKHEKGLAADLKLFDGLEWPEVHEEAATRGLHFPVYDKDGNHEDWHVEGDPAWVEPPPEPEEPDMQWRILTPAGSAAKFIAPMAPLPDGTLAALYATWLPTGHQVEAFASRGVTELGLAVEDLRNVTLLGPLPSGDVRQWTDADFLAVT